jgi:translation initiation factor IF-2
MAEKQIGKVTRYFDQIHVAVIELTAPIKLGDELIFRRGEDELAQTVESIQIDKQSLPKAAKGDSVGIEVHEPVKIGAKVFKD